MAEWDAATYQGISDPQVEWGREVLAAVDLRGDERAIDAGCGTGRVTRLLAERLPAGEVLAVDASQNMVDEARRRLADLAPRVRVTRADLLELEVDEPADLAFSTATFHWITDHARLFARLHAALAPGGALVAQCGGAGNVERTLAAADAVAREEPYAARMPAVVGDIHFATAAATATRLRAAGFAEARAWLHERPADVGDREAGARYLRAIVLRQYLELLPPELHEPFAQRVADRLVDARGRVVIDYVRLDIRAHRPGRRGDRPGR